jgi:putative lipoic acid-binding regulatory protein
MGRKERGFAQNMTDIVLKHAPDFDVASVEMRPSRPGTYLSVTCIVRAVSREQLDALYQELCDHPSVVMVL